MNKLISIQQLRKSGDKSDEQGQLEDYTEDEFLELNNTFLNELINSNNDIKNISITNDFLSVNSISESNDSNINNKNHKNECQNEKCIEVQSDIDKYTEECESLEKKIEMIDRIKTEEFFEISSKLSKTCKKIDALQPTIDACQGKNISNLSYEQLTKIEINLFKLLIKIRLKISKIESDIMKGNISKPEDTSTLCKICKTNYINCLLHPCSHVAICIDCVIKCIKCPVCSKFIEYYDKIYLPGI